MLLARSAMLHAGPINVPNGSFEEPATFFVSTIFESWQRTPQWEFWNENATGPWTNLTGIFKNTAPGNDDHIVNCDGNQAAWLFANPEVGLFQDYDAMDWNDPVPTRAFNAVYEVGKSYELTVGLFGGGAGRNYGMLEGVTLELSLYFRDAASNRVTVAATTITNSNELFPDSTNLVDFTVQVPIVKATDPWAGQHIGILMLSTVSSNLQGGYWDVDNVRLTSTAAPILTSPVWTNNHFQFTLLGETGRGFEILSATNVASPWSNWLVLGTVTNTTGANTFVDTNASFDQRFYRARQMP
ncbi:MAG TPA: hypothetical protein VFZ59_14850 [Verrucomicrobiae bacterium]|nr:hypothetical protein [Verrucomicrobiae bacterium]